MSQIAQKQDITDPDVITAFAKRMRDERHLTALYLLTVADIRGPVQKFGTPGKENYWRISIAPPYESSAVLSQIRHRS